MTIASEIERLQCAKADICTAIENKGVTVGNITLDCYAPCIDAIQGGNDNLIDVLVVGGGGGGGSTTGCWSGMVGGGGGAGGVEICYGYGNDACYNVVIGLGGVGCRKGGSGMGCNGGDSCFGDIIAGGGGGGGGGGAMNIQGCDAFNGGGGGGGGCQGCGGCGTKGNKGGDAIILCSGFSKLASGGGGGAMWRGQDATYSNGNGWYDGGFGGMGCTSNFTLESKYYGCGGVGTISCYGGGGVIKGPVSEGGGGGNGMNRCSCGSVPGQDGQSGLVIVRYKTGCANYMGGSERCRGDYTFHYFGRDGTLECITGSCPVVEILLIGGGGSGGRFFGGGGGGGGIVAGEREISGSICVHIGEGGTCLCNGGDSCFGSLVAYGGGAGNCSNVWGGCVGGSGGGSGLCRCGGCGIYGQGCNGGAYGVNQGGGGGGGNSNGLDGTGISGGCFGHGGEGFCSDISGEMCWYSGGGAGGGRCGGIGGCGGGGDSVADGIGCDATYYGGGGGGGCRCLAGAGYQGLLIVRYPASCGYNITGGTKYECNGYCIHCFTSDGTLTVN